MAGVMALRAPPVERAKYAANAVNLWGARRAQGMMSDSRKTGVEIDASKFVALADSQPVALDLIPARRCRWPIQTDGKGLTCCGALAEDGSYCPSHQQMSRDPAGTKRMDNYLFKKRGR